MSTNQEQGQGQQGQQGQDQQGNAIAHNMNMDEILGVDPDYTPKPDPNPEAGLYPKLKF